MKRSFTARSFEGRTRYRKFAELKYRFLPWIDPQPECVNPTLYVFRRDDKAGNPPRP